MTEKVTGRPSTEKVIALTTSIVGLLKIIIEVAAKFMK